MDKEICNSIVVRRYVNWENYGPWFDSEFNPSIFGSCIEHSNLTVASSSSIFTGTRLLYRAYCKSSSGDEVDTDKRVMVCISVMRKDH